MEHGANEAQVCRGLLSFLSTVYCCYCGHAWVHGCRHAEGGRVSWRVVLRSCWFVGPCYGVDDSRAPYMVLGGRRRWRELRGAILV